MNGYNQGINLDQLIAEIRKVTGTPAKSIDVPNGNGPFCKVYEHYDADSECHYSTVVRFSANGVDIAHYATLFNKSVTCDAAAPFMQRAYHLTFSEVEEIFLTNLTKKYFEEFEEKA
jgi:hypothetical protein